MSLTSGLEVVVGVRVAVPPGVTPEQARAMMSNNGISMPVGLLQFVRQTHVEIVQENEPVTIPSLDVGSKLRLQ